MSIRRNTYYNVLGAVLPMLVMVVTLPLYLDLIGEERYGVLALAWTLLGYFGMFEFGLSRATAQRIAVLDKATDDERATVFWTAFALNAVLGVVGALILLPIGYVAFGQYVDMADPVRREAVASVPWLAAMVPVATASAVFAGALQGRQRFLALNVITASGTVASTLILLGVAAWLGADLRWLLPAALGVRLLTISGLFVQCVRHVRLVGRPSARRALVRPLLTFGGWVWVGSVVAPVLEGADRFLVGALAGARSVTWYTVPQNLTSRATITATGLVSALYPRLASAAPEQLDRLTDEAFRALVVVLTLSVVGGLIIIEPFLILWLGADFAQRSADVGHLTALGFLCFGLAKLPAVRLQARGRPDLPTKCRLLEVVPYVAIVYLATRHGGIVGAAAAMAFRQFADAALLYGVSGYRPAPSVVLVPLVLLASCASAMMALPVDAPSRWLAGGVCMVLALIWGWQAAPPSLRGQVTRWLPPALRPA